MISILIPFRDDELGWRSRVLTWVRRYWEVHLAELDADYEIIIADSEDPNFNRAQARNIAYEKSRGDIVALVDADTVIEIASFKSCLEQLLTSDLQWGLPYVTYYALTQEATRQQLRRADLSLIPNPETEFSFPSPETPEPAVAGCVMVKRKFFFDVGGYDDRYTGWGLEDRDFAVRLDSKSPGTRVSGAAYHLWHPTNEAERFGQPHFEQNRAIYREICALFGVQPLC